MTRSTSDTPSGKGSSFLFFTRQYRNWFPSISTKPRTGCENGALYTPGASGAAALRSIGSAPVIITRPGGSPVRCPVASPMNVIRLSGAPSLSTETSSR